MAGTPAPDPPAGQQRSVGSFRHKLDIWSARSKDFLKLNTNQPAVFYRLAFFACDSLVCCCSFCLQGHICNYLLFSSSSQGLKKSRFADLC